MSVLILIWIVIGFVSGFLTSRFVNETGKGLFVDIGLGIVGAVAAGWVLSTFAMPHSVGPNLYGLLVPVAGAVIVLVAYRKFLRAER